MMGLQMLAALSRSAARLGSQQASWAAGRAISRSFESIQISCCDQQAAEVCSTQGQPSPSSSACTWAPAAGAKAQRISYLCAPRVDSPGPSVLAAWGPFPQSQLLFRHLSSKASHRFTDDYDKHHRVNDAIFSRKLKVLFPDGRSEVLSRRDALKAATSLKLDLVEFAGTTADPPIVKIADYRSLRNQRRKAHEEEVQRVKEKTAASAARRASAAAASSSSSGSGSGEAASGEKQQSRAAGAVRAAAKEPGQQQSAGGKGGAATSAAAGAKKAKVKEVFFSPKIHKHDIDIKLKKIRSWLEEGYRVNVAREVDSTDSPDAAEKALDSLTAQLADVGTAAKNKLVRSNLVSVFVNPKPAHGQQGHAAAAGAGAGSEGGKRQRRE